MLGRRIRSISSLVCALLCSSQSESALGPLLGLRAEGWGLGAGGLSFGVKRWGRLLVQCQANTHGRIGSWTRENALQALSALSLAIFTRPKEQNGLGWSVEELEVLLAEVRREFKDASIHAYWPM